MTWYYVCGAMLLGRMANCIDQQMLWTYIYVMNIYIYIYIEVEKCICEIFGIWEVWKE